MSISSSLCQGVDNFFDSSPKVLISLVIVLIALVFQCCSFGIASWSRSEISQLGLWSICSNSNYLTCCDTLSDSFESVPGWPRGTQVLQCLSLACLVIFWVLLILNTCVTECRSSKIVYGALVFCIGSAFFTFVSLITFGDNFRESDLLSDHHLHGCFFVAITVLIFLLITLTILVMEICSRPSSVSPEDREPPRAPPFSEPGQTLPNNRFPPSERGRARQPAQQLNVQTPNQENQCIACWNAPKVGVFIPCYHMACCEACANTIRNEGNNRCPICRRTIQTFEKIYNS